MGAKTIRHDTPLTVGCVNYINALPFYLSLSSVDFVFDTPQQLNNKLRNKELDAALSSSVEYLDGNYDMIPGLGIAAHQKVFSVNLYSQIPLPALDGKRLGVTQHSATSIQLLKILCHHFWKINPLFEPLMRDEPFSKYPAILMIGDEALRHLEIPDFQTIDLAQAWYHLTGLPFVFALFSVQKYVHKKQIEHLHTQLNASLTWSETHREWIEQEGARRCSIPHTLARHYFSCLKYRLGEKELEGLQLFQKMRRSDV